MTTLDGPFDHELESRWRNVKARLSAVLRNMQDNPVKTFPEEWNDIYTDVAKLYSQNDNMKMRRMYEHVRQYIRDLVDGQLHHLRLLDGTILLSEYVRRWKATMKYVRFMKRVLHHLQHFWIPENANTLKHDPIRPLDKLLMFYWREDLLSNLPSVVDIALNLVDEDRRGNHANRDVVRGIVDNFVEIGAADVCDESSDRDSVYCLDNHLSSQFFTLHLYVQVFEGRFLSRTREFYKDEGVRIARDGNIKFFVEQIRTRLSDEEERVRVLLHKDSALRVRKAAEAELIGNHKEYLQSEANKMIREGRNTELHVIFKLLERVEDGLVPIRNFLIKFIRDEGNAIVVKHADELDGNLSIPENLILIERLLSLYLRHANMTDRCFDGSNMIVVAIENAFRGFVNRSLGPVSIPHLLAYYIDRLLRSRISDGFHVADEDDDGEDTEGASNDNCTRTVLQFCKLSGLAVNLSHNTRATEELLRDRLLNELVRFFGYLDDKDMFFEAHRILFAKRLLYGSNGTLESDFISKLRLKAGNTYTQRLTGMLQDIELLKPFRERFASYVDALRFHCLDDRQPPTHRETEKGDHRSLSEIKEILYEESDKIGSMLRLSVPPLQQRWFRTNASGSITHAPRQSQVNHAVQRLRHSNPRLHKPFNPLETLDVPWRPGMSGTRFRPDKSVLDALNIDFNGHVLNALHWPSEKKLDLNVPDVLKTCQELFSDFYMRDKKPRKLTWVHSASMVHLKARLGSSEYIFVLSTVQACFLLLLNDKAQVSVMDAARKLNISSEDLLEHLEPLLVAKRHQLLSFCPPAVPTSGQTSVPPQSMPMSAKFLNSGACNTQDRRLPGMTKGLFVSPLLGDLKKRKVPCICATQAPSVKRQRISSSPPNSAPEVSLTRTVGNLCSDNKVQLPSVRQILASAPVPGASLAVLSLPKPLQLPIAHSPPPQLQPLRQLSSQGVRHSALASSQRGHLKSNVSRVPGSHICVNENFRSDHRRIVFPALSSRMGGTKATIAVKNVVMDRNTQVDAVLVRIMKSREQANYGEICAEVISALSKQHFMPDPKLIKQRLERLIDQEYISRDENDPKMYRYTV